MPVKDENGVHVVASTQYDRPDYALKFVSYPMLGVMNFRMMSYELFS